MKKLKGGKMSITNNSSKGTTVNYSIGIGTFLYFVGLVTQTGGWFWLSLLVPPFGIYFGTETVLKGLGWL
jgi:hypothetical protein